MRPLISFMNISLDGYQEGPDGAFDWPQIGPEFLEFSGQQMDSIDTLLFGRTTYVEMADYWTKPEAFELSQDIAERMNSIAKVVFSATLAEADAGWNNSTLVSGDPAAAIAEMKQQPGREMALFGSPTFTASLLEQGLVDELRVIVQPLLWGGGTTLFSALTRRVDLQLVRTLTFTSGNVLLSYRPAA